MKKILLLLSLLISTHLFAQNGSLVFPDVQSVNTDPSQSDSSNRTPSTRWVKQLFATSGNYILNGTTLQSGASFYIGGSGRVTSVFEVDSNVTIKASRLNINSSYSTNYVGLSLSNSNIGAGGVSGVFELASSTANGINGPNIGETFIAATSPTFADANLGFYSPDSLKFGSNNGSGLVYGAWIQSGLHNSEFIMLNNLNTTNSADSVLVIENHVVKNQAKSDMGFAPASSASPAPIGYAHDTTITANYTAASGDHYIEINATSGNITLTLPTASTYQAVGTDGKHYIAKLEITRTDASANTVTITCQSGQTLNGNASTTLAVAAGYEIHPSSSTTYVIN
jgi:hypothetical protein